MNEDLDLLVSLGDHDTPQSAAERAARAEDRGFAAVSVGETTGWNVVPALTLMADRTEEITLATDVFSPFSRSPAMLAQTALALDAAADGRYRLGLGPSSPAITERWHGFEFDRPLRRTRETIEIVRAVFAEGSPAYDGDLFEIPGLNYERQRPEEPPKVDLGTLGPKATELAGRFGDGWAPQLFTADGLRDRLGDLERGAELGGKTLDDIRVNPIVRCFAADDPDRARETVRANVAFMLGAYGPYYGDSVAEQGYEEDVAAIRAAWEEKDTAGMSAALSDDLLDELAPAGTPEHVREWVEAYAAVDGVDAVRIGFARGMSDSDKTATMDVLSELC